MWKSKVKFLQKLLQGRNGREIISSDLGLIFIYLSATIGTSGATGMVKSRSILCFILFYSIWQRDNSLNQWVLQAQLHCGFVSQVHSFGHFLTISYYQNGPNLSTNGKIISPHTFPHILYDWRMDHFRN